MRDNMEVDCNLTTTERAHLSSILQCVETGVLAWYEIVNTFGLDAADKATWQEEFLSYIKATVDECKEIALERQQALNEKIASLLEESAKLCKTLGIRMPQFAPTNQGMYKDEKYLISMVKGWQDEVNSRMEEINLLKARRDEISKTLGRKPFHIRESPLPKREDLDTYLEKIEILEAEKQQRVVKYHQIQEEIAALAAEIQYSSRLDFERHVINGDDGAFELSDENMQRVMHFHYELTEKRDNIEEELNKLRESLQHLWKILDEDVKYCNDFIRDNVGLNMSTLEAFKLEVGRCEDIRKANLQKFIVKLREELVELWNKACYSKARREHFMEHMEDNLYTEDLLTLHDNQIEKVKSYINKNTKIFALLGERDVLYKRMRELEERANAPDRFKNRGGQLLKEEKERKAVTKKIPVIEEQLLDLIAIYETEYGEKFMYWEETVEDMIAKAREFMEQTSEISLRTLLRRAVIPLSVHANFPHPDSTRKMQSKRTPLFKSPSASTFLASRNKLTPSILKTPVTRRNLMTPNTAPVKRGALLRTTTARTTGRRSITKAKARRSVERRSMDKRRRLQALRANANANMNDNDVDYSNFQDNVSKRSTLAEQTNLIPRICVETPSTVDRRLKLTMPKTRLQF